jgi:hypothetical protein
MFDDNDDDDDDNDLPFMGNVNTSMTNEAPSDQKKQKADVNKSF